VALGWWALNSPTFAVVRVESGDYRYTNGDSLQAVLNSFLGRNIWTLDTGRVAADVANLPWIQEVQVTRRLPGKVKVDFSEWRPLLMAEDAGQENLVLMADGRLIAFPAQLVLPGLPTLVGAGPFREGPEGELRLPAEQIAQLLELVLAMEDAGLETVSAVDFVVAGPKGFSIVLQHDDGELLLGREEFRPRLERYMLARHHLGTNQMYDLRFKNRITWQQED